MISLESMADLIADLSERADAGDDDAAIQLNRVASTVPPELMLAARARPPILRYQMVEGVAQPTIEQVFGIAAGEPDPWDLPEQSVGIAISHYGVDPQDAWAVAFDLENEIRTQSGLPMFGRLFDRPWGVPVLAYVIASEVNLRQPPRQGAE